MKIEFIKRAQEGALTMEENPLTHFCVYFAPYDPEYRQVFIGHHKRSGLWLFNGGHIDKGELPPEALAREMKEEWGASFQSDNTNIYAPSLLSITTIDTSIKFDRQCRRHYDIWYFIPLHKHSFNPDNNFLAKEFHQIGWKMAAETRNLIKDVNTLTALRQIEKLFQ